MDLKNRTFPKSVLHVNCDVCGVTFPRWKEFRTHLFMLIVMFVVHFFSPKEELKLHMTKYWAFMN